MKQIPNESESSPWLGIDILISIPIPSPSLSPISSSVSSLGEEVVEHLTQSTKGTHSLRAAFQDIMTENGIFHLFNQKPNSEKTWNNSLDISTFNNWPKCWYIAAAVYSCNCSHTALGKTTEKFCSYRLH